MKRLMPIFLLFFSLALMVSACTGTDGDEVDGNSATSATGPPTGNKGAENDDDSGEEMGATDGGTERDEDSAESAQRSFAGQVPAPEFPPGLDWLNIDEPLSLADLRGKIVLLDFWTYGCINCMHVIPDLKRLEEKYAEELVVIGVHSAKFENEGETENIRRIIQRYELAHPVINDSDFFVWNEYGARAWPTFVLIDPRGNVVGYQSGEGIYDLFDFVIGQLIQEFDGEIDRTPLALALEEERLANSPLLFPGKVLADEANGRLFIADSNHNRIVVADLAGSVIAVIGSGRSGLQDGTFETSQFFRPQGMSLAGDSTLYVADTENHAIRRVNLVAETVETVAGTGQQVYMSSTSGPAGSTPLNSPWDVLFHDGLLYVAMAGQHQLWVYDPDAEHVRVFAGSGREELLDGSLDDGGLNQPSGLATDGEVIYFADSEASAVRRAELDEDTGRIQTIVGTGLFDYGDVDGQGDQVRLQHPLGITFQDGILYVADTYNSKIKIVDPETREAQTFLGGTEAGWRDGAEPLFDEPGGLSITSGKLYVADTNNHAIRAVDLANREVSTLVLIDNHGFLTRQPAEEFNGNLITLERQEVRAGEGILKLDVVVPAGYKINDIAPFSMDWAEAGGVVTLDAMDAKRSIVAPVFPLEIPATFREGNTTLTGHLVIYYCETEAQSLCLIEQVRLVVPVTVGNRSGNTLVVTHVIPEPPVAD